MAARALIRQRFDLLSCQFTGLGIARAACFEVCRFDGSAHRYNQEDPRYNELVVCRPGVNDRVLAALAQVGA